MLKRIENQIYPYEVLEKLIYKNTNQIFLLFKQFENLNAKYQLKKKNTEFFLGPNLWKSSKYHKLSKSI